jgi:hypothetical protein
MMDKLTVEQRAKVASEVTGKLCVPAEDGVIWHKRYSADQFRWGPEMSGNYVAAWQRSQALALVEWLAGEITKMVGFSPNSKERREGRSYERKWRVAIKDRDIPALESLAHELLEPK